MKMSLLNCFHVLTVKSILHRYGTNNKINNIHILTVKLTIKLLMHEKVPNFDFMKLLYSYKYQKYFLPGKIIFNLIHSK